MLRLGLGPFFPQYFHYSNRYRPTLLSNDAEHKELKPMVNDVC